MTRGVILVAVGHPFYGNYAHNLAMSIKAVTPDVPVVCLTDGEGTRHLNNPVFDSLIQIDKAHIKTNGLDDYLKAKLYIYDYSPFDETIYIDADVLWTPRKKITDLFDTLKDVNFTIGNHSKIDIKEAKKGFIHWTDPKNIRDILGIKEGMLYNLSSEFIYFKKGDEIKLLFDIAKDFHEDPRIDYTRFGTGVPDELSFEIAILKTGIYPHTSPFLPFYWEHCQKKSWEPFQIYDYFYGISLGGNTIDFRSQTTYDNLGKSIARKFNRLFFTCKNKKSFLSERSKI